MSYHFDLSEKISKIGLSQWESLAGLESPFLRYEFLNALEQSGSVSAAAGWQPQHLRIFKDHQCIALAPLYLKTHSYGEYVFDYVWSDAYLKHGMNYYPKLVTAVPFSPITLPKILSHLPTNDAYHLFSQIIKQICNEQRIESWHGLFMDSTEKECLIQDRMIPRLGVQYHWFNKDYRSFEHFLERFNSRKRKNVHKERRKITEQGIVIDGIEGADISSTLLDTFYQCYQLTHLKRGRQGYLNKAFFQQLLDTMPEQIVMFAAKQGNTYVATALCFKNKDTLFGRYWGSLNEYDSLHFETCFYQGIEYCIKHQLKRFDPGAQGEHKILRGFEPIETYSCHHIEHSGFQKAIAQFCQEEEQQMIKQIDELKSWLPFKADH